MHGWMDRCYGRAQDEFCCETNTSVSRSYTDTQAHPNVPTSTRNTHTHASTHPQHLHTHLAVEAKTTPAHRTHFVYNTDDFAPAVTAASTKKGRVHV